MKKTVMSLIALGAFATVATPVLAETFIRKGNQAINVRVKGGRLYCTRVKDGFEMCNGMVKKGGAWKGANMKHPDMPGFMTFNGTVRKGRSSLSIKGCAIGQSMCDSEVWKRK